MGEQWGGGIEGGSCGAGAAKDKESSVSIPKLSPVLMACKASASADAECTM